VPVYLWGITSVIGLPFNGGGCWKIVAGGPQHTLDDAFVAGAAAKVTRQRLPDLSLARCVTVLEYSVKF